jgi:phosphoserine phosphatase RsbU/P
VALLPKSNYEFFPPAARENVERESDGFCAKLENQMMSLKRTTARSISRSICRSLMFLCVCVLPVIAQGPSGPSSSSPQNAAATAVRTVLNLDGPWKFQQGDDPRWADPALDDRNWLNVTLGTPLVQQGVDNYSGYGWYRLQIQPQQLALLGNSIGSTPLSLLLISDSVGQLAAYVNGAEAGHTKGLADQPSEYLSPPVVIELPATGNKAVTLAIRSWAGPKTKIRYGLLTAVELGSRSDIANHLALTRGNHWTQSVISPLALTCMFLCVALLGAALYIAQRHHAEYLWLALLCLSIAAGEAAGVAFNLERIPLWLYNIFIVFTGRIFMAVTLEFILRFTGYMSRTIVRGFQIAILLVPFVYLSPFETIYQELSVTAEIVFCALVCVLLFRAWRQGRTEAGVMLVPFFLAATADSADTVLDYAASKHWLPERFAFHSFHLGPIAFGTSAVAFTIFLSSLVAVILYRFIRVSQEEQRSTAEIAAARSVQALLIPTQLPSTRNFMLESAYLPANGVGGDFFQVLPLKDESLLIVVGDVSGKGLQAAMNSSTLVGALRNELSHDPATVLSHLNHVLIGAVATPGAVPDLDCAPCFATCLCARVYPDGTTTVANAGHLNPYRDGRELQLTPSLPLGVIADSEYEQTSFRLNRGDRLVFLSDGVVEATNSEGELFGFERTQQVSHEPARYIAQTAQHFGQTDDITVLSVYVASRAAQRDSENVVYTN